MKNIIKFIIYDFSKFKISFRILAANFGDGKLGYRNGKWWFIKFAWMGNFGVFSWWLLIAREGLKWKIIYDREILSFNDLKKKFNIVESQVPYNWSVYGVQFDNVKCSRGKWYMIGKLISFNWKKKKNCNTLESQVLHNLSIGCPSLSYQAMEEG